MDDYTQKDENVVTSQRMTRPRSNSLTIPIAIVLGFGLIAAAIFFSGGVRDVPKNTDTTVSDLNETEVTTKGPIRAVDENDHIRGNPNAPIVLIEYSDYECPFCKSFHETMNTVMKNYGSSGQVAWVYRHFPLEQLHPTAPRISQASECVSELGGNDAFWKFTDLIFSERGTNEPTNMSRLSEFAATSGVSKNAFESCLEDGRTKSAVEEDLADGINAGARGTPHTIVLVGGQQGVISGAQPYEAVSQIIDTLITQIEGSPEVQ